MDMWHFGSVLIIKCKVINDYCKNETFSGFHFVYLAHLYFTCNRNVDFTTNLMGFMPLFMKPG